MPTEAISKISFAQSYHKEIYAYLKKFSLYDISIKETNECSVVNV